MNGLAQGRESVSSRLDNAIERIASSRPSASSRTNSVASSLHIATIPNSADPVYATDITLSPTTVLRSSIQSDRASETLIDAQIYNAGMPPPRTEGTTQRQRQAEDWQEKGASRQVIRSVVNGTRQEKIVRKGVRDFNFARTLGEGSYSTVIAATDRQTLKEYAIKVLDKRHIIKEKKVKYVNIEKNTLFRLGDHPGVVRLYYTFQDESSLYFVLDLATNGELLGVLKKLATFDEECARYYSAQILDAIDYMHSKGVIHRDLKPENVLLDDKMRVKIADFGTAKLLDLPTTTTTGDTSGADEHVNELDGMEQPERANSFVGTAEYVSPELLTEKSTCKASDLWALGCILFQLLTGKPPFKAVNEYQTFQKIVKLEYTIPNNFPPKAADLVKRLLVLDPLQRLSVPEIRSHEFFSEIDWETLWKIKAPKLRPYRPRPIVLSVAAQAGPKIQSPTNSSPTSVRSAASRPLPVANSQPPTEPSTNPSELDLQYSSVLSLPFERILRLGQLSVLTADGEKIPRKFHKILQRKKTKQLMVTSHGRCLYLDADQKVRGEIRLTGPQSTQVRAIDAKQFLVETPVKSYLYEDGSGHVTAWIQALVEANHRVLQLQLGVYGDGTGGAKVEEKRKSRIGFGH